MVLECLKWGLRTGARSWLLCLPRALRLAVAAVAAEAAVTGCGRRKQAQA